MANDRCLPEETDFLMGGLRRSIEFSRLVGAWCLANEGCTEVPCSCRSRFIEPDFYDSDEPIELVLRTAPRAPLTLVWSRD